MSNDKIQYYVNIDDGDDDDLSDLFWAEIQKENERKLKSGFPIQIMDENKRPCMLYPDGHREYVDGHTEYP